MIKNGSKVKLNYTGKLKNGQIFDSSLNEGRQPLDVIVGDNRLITGFENGIMGMSVGETKIIDISPEEGYGQIRQDLVITVPKTSVPDGIQVGQVLNPSNNESVNFEVMEVNEDNVVLDGNHPLAGENLLFEVEILEVSD